MVVHESFVTRKPLEFTIIVLFVLFIILIPVYYLTKNGSEPASESVLLDESYEETSYWFSSESDLTDDDKRILFRTVYENNFVQWSGNLLACAPIPPLFRVSMDHTGNGFGDVLFTTYQNCTNITKGSKVAYKTKLIDLKVRTFTGTDGEFLTWG